MKKNREAFTLIELIFIIVIIGILSAVALPKLTATRDDALIDRIVIDLKVMISDLENFYMAQGEKGFNLAKWSDITDSIYFLESSQLVINSTVSIDSCFEVTVTTSVSNQILINIITPASTNNICNQSKNIAVKKGLLNSAYEREIILGHRVSF